MAESRIIFKHCAEALITGLGADLTPQLKEQLSKLGLSTDRELPPAFEHEQWTKILAAVGESLVPGNAPAAHHQIGERITDAYLDNFIGRALKPVIKLIGMRRAMGRMRQNFRVANNYSEAEATELGPGNVELHVNETGMMAYFYRGVLARGLLICDPKNLHVEVAREEPGGVVFSVRWDA